MKRLRKAAALSAAAVLLCTGLSAGSVQVSAEEFMEGVLTFSRYADYAEAVICVQDCTGELVIPAVVEGLPVRKVSFGGTRLTSIVIPEGVTEVTVSSCPLLEQVSLPDSLRILGDFAFSDCPKLKTIVIPDGVTEIGEQAFYQDIRLTDVTIPESVRSIGGGAFRFSAWMEAKQQENPLVVVNSILIDGMTCTGEVQIPEGVTQIVDYAFAPTFELTGVQFPESLERIGASAFEGLNLKSVLIPEHVKQIDYRAFADCPALESIKVMNPLCDFALSYEPGDGKGGPDAYTPSFSGLTGKLIGYTGSTAETYAELFGHQFESLGDAEPLLSGDYNGDGAIGPDDAQNILNVYTRSLSGKKAAVCTLRKTACDISGDGSIGVEDAQAVLQYYVKNTLSSVPTPWERFVGR